MIFDKIVEYADKYEIGFIGYDPYKARELISMINAGGGSSSTKAIRQTFGVFTPMTMAMKRLICTNNIVIDDNPVNQYCFENAILVRDGYDNCKIMKRAHNDKIDGAIALLMALKFYMDE